MTMPNRHSAQVVTSEDEENAPPLRNVDDNQKKRKNVHLTEDETEKLNSKKKQKTKENEDEDEDEEEEEEDEEMEAVKEDDSEEEDVEVKPLGEVVRVSGKGRGKKSHYNSFECDGRQFELEDTVLLIPEEEQQKPYVAIIKDIAQSHDGAVMVTGQWFYRPEEAEKRSGGFWQARDTRELFYSFHRDEVPAASVMHKCEVHFIPPNKQIPDRKEHPGFVVQKVYDTVQRRLFKLTDKDYEDDKQHEVDLLVQKTLARLGDLPELEPVDHEDQMKNKRLLRKRFMTPLDVSGEDEVLSRSQSLKADTPGSTTAIVSEYLAILSKLGLLTGETHRDKWLEKLLQSMQFICSPVGSKQRDDEEQRGSDVRSPVNKKISSNIVNGSVDKNHNENASFDWPDAAASAVAALEKSANDSLSGDFQKYNQKMRQLTFNLKGNAGLARRFLNRELEPAQILNMSPNELKEGLTAKEIASREPEESDRMQMTDARCKRCFEKQVSLMDIIHTGHGDRYQLECVACGNTWYASRDATASLTIEAPSSAKTVGTAPLATAKFEDVEKNLISPRGSDKGANDFLKKTTEEYVPVLNKQRSFTKTRVEENPSSSK